MATMVSTAEFLPYVLPGAPKVSALTAEFNVRLAAIEFCERTRIWRHMVDATLTQNAPVVVGPDYAAIHEIERAFWGNEYRLTPKAFTELPPGWETAQTAPPEIITQFEPDKVILYPFQPGRLTMSVFLKPRADRNFVLSGSPMRDYYNQVPDFLLNQHAEAIGCGALARVLVIPDHQWSNPDLAAYHRAQFNQACDRNFAINLAGQQRAPRRTRYNDF